MRIYFGIYIIENKEKIKTDVNTTYQPYFYKVMDSSRKKREEY